MPEISIVRKIYKWKPSTSRPVGRPKSRLEDDVRNDLRKMKLILLHTYELLHEIEGKIRANRRVTIRELHQIVPEVS